MHMEGWYSCETSLCLFWHSPPRKDSPSFWHGHSPPGCAVIPFLIQILAHSSGHGRGPGIPGYLKVNRLSTGSIRPIDGQTQVCKELWSPGELIPRTLRVGRTNSHKLFSQFYTQCICKINTSSFLKVDLQEADRKAVPNKGWETGRVRGQERGREWGMLGWRR